jgi:hypothetical protein
MKYYEPLKKFYGIKILNNFLYEIQKKCKNIILLSQNTPTITNIKVEDKELRSVFDKRTSTLLFEYYILQIFNEYILLTKDPLMIQKILVFTKRNSGDNDNDMDVKNMRSLSAPPSRKFNDDHNFNYVKNKK